VCRQYKSPISGHPVQLVAAGGMFDGRSVASALMLGADAVWVGTRFVTANESAAPDGAKKS
jgi:NAD(P)H-dependent flavin oxidoreductase YrpB (nitropropane dioxygenase family)